MSFCRRLRTAIIGDGFNGHDKSRSVNTMPEATTHQEYAEFIRRIRQGDEQAAEELVRRYEPEIRLEVRGWLRLRNPGLKRVFDSMDICQSVMASFFARAAVGDFDLEEPPQLIRLLVGMGARRSLNNPAITSANAATCAAWARGLWTTRLRQHPHKHPAAWPPDESCCRSSGNFSRMTNDASPI